MEKTICRRKMIAMMLCGIAGCVLMAAGDWLMIYGDPTYEGNLSWLTLGAAQIAPWRNTLAMALAFPAVVFYSVGLFGIRHFLTDEKSRRRYTALTMVGMLPWLCLHLFYIMILYLFSWLSGNGYAPQAAEIGEAMFRHFSWLVAAAQVFMILPYCDWFGEVWAGKSVFSRKMALNNPLILYVILKGITMVMSVSAFRLAMINGLMSESMAIWFLIFILWLARTGERRPN